MSTKKIKIEGIEIEAKMTSEPIVNNASEASICMNGGTVDEDVEVEIENDIPGAVGKVIVPGSGTGNIKKKK